MNQRLFVKYYKSLKNKGYNKRMFDAVFTHQYFSGVNSLELGVYTQFIHKLYFRYIGNDKFYVLSTSEPYVKPRMILYFEGDDMRNPWEVPEDYFFFIERSHIYDSHYMYQHICFNPLYNIWSDNNNYMPSYIKFLIDKCVKFEAGSHRYQCYKDERMLDFFRNLYKSGTMKSYENLLCGF